MIRRLFWMSLGAFLGITGYRRVTALARTAPALRARELTRFAGDVREGMEMYRQRQLAAPRRAIERPTAALRAGELPARPTEHVAEDDH
jgi:hypothetical protein